MWKSSIPLYYSLSYLAVQTFWTMIIKHNSVLKCHYWLRPKLFRKYQIILIQICFSVHFMFIFLVVFHEAFLFFWLHFCFVFLFFFWICCLFHFVYRLFCFCFGPIKEQGIYKKYLMIFRPNLLIQSIVCQTRGWLFGQH